MSAKRISFLAGKKGFTLVELMVTVSIVAVLATIGITSFSQIQKKARISKRSEDLKSIQTALEIYRNVRGQYPTAAGYSCAPSVLGSGVLVPTYMLSIPQDPLGGANCYEYTSPTGLDYKIRSNGGGEMTVAEFNSQSTLVDPAKDITPGNGCQVDSARATDPGWAYYSATLAGCAL